MDEPATAVGDDATTGGDLRTAFEEHAAALLRLCTLLTGRREIAEDLVQDAFVRLAPKVERLEADAVWPYLRRIAVNLWKNRLRRLALEARHRGAEPAEVPDLDPDRTAVWAAVQTLPPRQRTTVVLRYYEDLTEAETARVMGCSVGTVKSQTAKALTKLEQELADED